MSESVGSAPPEASIHGPVGIVGLGLIGGSIGRDLKALPDPPEVLGSSTDLDDLVAAREAGAVDRGFPEPDSVVHESRTVILAVPLGALLQLLRDHRRALAGKHLVMDVASLKAPVLRAAANAEISERFVGAHPMAGGEGSGFAASRDGLFHEFRIWLAEEGATPEVREGAEAFWSALGGVPSWTHAEEHDRRMAWCSHLPQLVSNALAGALDAAGYGPEDLGPGGRDMIRLAGSSPEMWKDLFERSGPGVGLGLESVSRALRVLADLLARKEIDSVASFMERTRDWRGEEPWS